MLVGRVGVRRRPREQQLTLLRTSGWGGRRQGAGRRRDPRSGVRHARRQRFGNLPVHVTLRLLPHVWNLRSRRCFSALKRAFAAGRELFGARICHFSVQGNHIHIIVEGIDDKALSRAMQGLTIRMAKALNRVMGRRGKVFADRYHAHVLRTPREVRNAVAYVLGNHLVHARRAARRVPAGVDPCSSSAHTSLEAPAQTWLLRRAAAAD